MLTEVATYFPELNLRVFKWVCFIFSDDAADTDTGQFDFLPSTYVRRQYEEKWVYEIGSVHLVFAAQSY